MSELYVQKTMLDANGKVYTYNAYNETLAGFPLPTGKNWAPCNMPVVLPERPTVKEKTAMLHMVKTRWGTKIPTLADINELVDRYLALLIDKTPEERRAMGYVLATDVKGVKCAITGLKCAVYVICQHNDGTFTEKNLDGTYNQDSGRVKYVAVWALPTRHSIVGNAGRLTEYPYGRAKKDGDAHIGKFCKTRPYMTGIEVECNFFRDEWGRVLQLIWYATGKVWLNPQGVLGTILLKFSAMHPVVTADSTVDFELLLDPMTALNGIQDRLCPLNELVDVKSACGTHIHMSRIDENFNMVWDRLSEASLFGIAQDLFSDWLSNVELDPVKAAKAFGRSANHWANGYVGEEDHHSAINLSGRHLEFRIPKCTEAAKYKATIDLVTELAEIFHEAFSIRYVSESDYQNSLDTLKDKVWAVWDEANGREIFPKAKKRNIRNS